MLGIPPLENTKVTEIPFHVFLIDMKCISKILKNCLRDLHHVPVPVFTKIAKYDVPDIYKAHITFSNFGFSNFRISKIPNCQLPSFVFHCSTFFKIPNFNISKIAVHIPSKVSKNLDYHIYKNITSLKCFHIFLCVVK